MHELSVARVLRVFRPIKIISKFLSMRIVVASIAASVPKMLNVLLFMLVVFVSLSIVSVQFFQGALYQCINPATVRARDGYF